ncbi:outer membrane beta-barrel protein [candidate division KSB1 bacterium]|nr:outer membrane beta-barrel protein [candidate division KSB1 bacterium]
MTRFLIFGLLIFVIIFLNPLPATALDGGIHLIIASPQDKLAETMKTGMGLGGKFIYTFDMQPWFSIRSDLGYLSYDSKQRIVQVGGYPMYETSRSEGFRLSIGPQLNLNNTATKFYLSPQVGYHYFQTVLSLPELAYYDIYAVDTKDSYGAFGWAVYGGFMFDIGLGPWIDIGIGYNYLFDGVRQKVDEKTVRSDGTDITVTLGVVFIRN